MPGRQRHMLSVEATDGDGRHDGETEIRILLVEKASWLPDYLSAFGVAAEDAAAGDTVFQQVDDSLAGFGEALNRTNWRVVAAQTPALAVNACVDALKADMPFHVAFVDAELSGPESGVALVSRLQSLDPRLFAVISGPRGSGSPLATVGEASGAGKVLLLAKPFFGWEAVHAVLHAKALWDEADSARGSALPPLPEEPAVALNPPLALARFDPRGQPLAVNEAFLLAHPELMPHGKRGLSLRKVLEMPPFMALAGRAAESANPWRVVELEDGSTRAAAFVREADGNTLVAEINLTDEMARLAQLRRADERDCALRRWESLLDALSSAPAPGDAQVPRDSSWRNANDPASRLRAASCPAALMPSQLHLGRAVAQAVEAVSEQLVEVDLFEAHRPWDALADEAEFHTALSLLFQGLAENAGEPLSIEAETANVRLDETAAAQLRCEAGDYARLGLRIENNLCGEGDVEDMLNPLGLLEADRTQRLGLLRCYSFARQSGGYLDLRRDEHALRIDVLLPRARAGRALGNRTGEGGSRNVA